MIAERASLRVERVDDVEGVLRWYLVLEMPAELPIYVGPYDDEDQANAAAIIVIESALERTKAMGVPVEAVAVGGSYVIALRAGGHA